MPSYPIRRLRKRPAGVEPAHPPWQSSTLPLHHGRIESLVELSKIRAPGGTRTHVAALRVRSPRRWTTSATIRMGPEGLEPSPTWLRARRSATRALVPSLQVNSCNLVDSIRPGRSRTFVSRLTAECSALELRAVVIQSRLPQLSAPGESNPSSLPYKGSALPLS